MAVDARTGEGMETGTGDGTEVDVVLVLLVMALMALMALTAVDLIVAVTFAVCKRVERSPLGCVGCI